MTEIKCYVDGCYTFGHPDYGGIYVNATNKLVYTCDYGVTLKDNARACANRQGWKFLRMYKDRRYDGMVLVFDFSLIGCYFGILSYVKKINSLRQLPDYNRIWNRITHDFGWIRNPILHHYINVLVMVGFLEYVRRPKGPIEEHGYKITEIGKQALEKQ